MSDLHTNLSFHLVLDVRGPSVQCPEKLQVFFFKMHRFVKRECSDRSVPYGKPTWTPSQPQQEFQQPKQPGLESSQQQPKKPGIRFMLKDHSEMDRKWRADQDKWNDQQIDSNVVIIGSWQIVAQKWVRLEFKPSTGETWVVFEQHPNKHGFFTGLRLTEREWFEFQTYFAMILRYISNAETGGSWQNMAKTSPLHHYEAKKKKFQSGIYQEMVRFLVCEDDLYVTLMSYDSTSLGGCTVDIRRCTFVENESKNRGKHLVHLLKGLTLVGGGFHYMAKYLQPRINGGLKMCEAMYIGGQPYISQMKSEFDSCSSQEQQLQANNFCMGNIQVLDGGNIVPVGWDEPDDVESQNDDNNHEEESELIRIAREIEEREFGFRGD